MANNNRIKLQELFMKNKILKSGISVYFCTETLKTKAKHETA